MIKALPAIIIVSMLCGCIKSLTASCSRTADGVVCGSVKIDFCKRHPTDDYCLREKKPLEPFTIKGASR
jgi:hypothetical protein